MTKSVLSQYVCRVEGHGNLKLNFEKKKAKLFIDEGERLFERLVLDRPFLDAPFITARICGICPTSHVLASVKAIENAFDVKVTDNIISLRKVLLAGQIIQSHILHLYFLVAPDYFGVNNALELQAEHPTAFRNALTLKKLADSIVEKVGGRSVHPTTPTVGGFLSVPNKKELKELAEETERLLHIALETVELFSGIKYPSLKRETEYLATQKNGKLSYYDGEFIVSNKKLKTKVENYEYAFNEEVRQGSTTKYGKINGHGFMVGALARLSLDTNSLHPKAAFAYSQIWGKTFPSYNSFHNNVAQAIEVVHLMEDVITELQKVIEDNNEVYKVGYRVKAGQGIAAVEAPRGTLYHAVRIDEKGFINLYDIVVPTVQNLLNLEEDADFIMKNNKNSSEKELQKEIEMLIRSYDPCITCSVH